MFDLTGMTALVTGASGGIGSEIAKALAAQGARLAVSGSNADKLEAFRASLGGDHVALPCNLSDAAAVDALVPQTVEALGGKLDILVNNAGAFDGGYIAELSKEAWDHVVAVNLTAPFLCTQHAFRIMKQQGGGRIINIASISAQRVRPKSAAYSATKHGVWGLTQVTALEGREHGIVCSCLHPGNVRIERRAASEKPEDQEPMMSVEDIAEAVLFMAAQPPHVNVLEAIVMPPEQLYIGRG